MKNASPQPSSPQPDHYIDSHPRSLKGQNNFQAQTATFYKRTLLHRLIIQCNNVDQGIKNKTSNVCMLQYGMFAQQLSEKCKNTFTFIVAIDVAVNNTEELGIIIIKYYECVSIFLPYLSVRNLHLISAML